MSRIAIEEAVIYSEKDPTAAEQRAGIRYQAGHLAREELINRDIEDRDVRKLIPMGEGNICVSIAPGSELGELTFNVQFEGTYGEYDFCMKHENELMLLVGEWLREITEELKVDATVRIEGQPCPKTEERLRVDLAAQVLEGQRSAAEAVAALSQEARTESRSQQRSAHDLRVGH